MEFKKEAFFEALEKNNRDMVKTCLLQIPELANTFTEEGMLPLALAGRYGYFEIAKELITFGADVNKKLETVTSDERGCTPLHATLTGSGDDRIVKLLLEKGADPMFKDSEGRSLLELASTHNFERCFQLLKQYGA